MGVCMKGVLLQAYVLAIYNFAGLYVILFFSSSISSALLYFASLRLRKVLGPEVTSIELEISNQENNLGPRFHYFHYSR